MIQKRDVLFTPTNKMRTLHIWVPDDYEQSDEQYPVMYFFDGHNLFSDADATYGKSWGLASFLETWEKKMIIVGIECGHEGRERLSEYCPYTVNSGFLGGIAGIGDETLRWLVEELKPMIDRKYRTYYFREATGIAGSSMGGLMSLYAAIRWNRYFSKAACLSSAVSLCMSELEFDLTGNLIDPDTRVYLSWGTEEAGGTRETLEADLESATGKRNRRLAHFIREKGADARIFCQRGGHHCEADWEEQVEGFMNYLWLDR